MTSLPKPAAKREKLWTEEEFLALPETNRRVELVDGEVVRESPDFTHQDIVRLVARSLETWAAARTPRPTVAFAPLDVRFGAGRILQPDVMVFLDPLERGVPMPLTRIPDLCIEIVSSNRAYDRTLKREIYADAGVREYWTVVPSLHFAERWTGPRLATREECRESLASLVLEGFTLDVAALLNE